MSCRRLLWACAWVAAACGGARCTFLGGARLTSSPPSPAASVVVASSALYPPIDPSPVVLLLSQSGGGDSDVRDTPGDQERNAEGTQRAAGGWRNGGGMTSWWWGGDNTVSPHRHFGPGLGSSYGNAGGDLSHSQHRTRPGAASAVPGWPGQPAHYGWRN